MPIEDYISTNGSGKEALLRFTTLIEYAKTKCKNYHWSAENKSIHETFDKLYDVLNEYEDDIVEESLYVFGTFDKNALKLPNEIMFGNYFEYLEFIFDVIYTYYAALGDTAPGITSQLESFMHEVNKIGYLLKLEK